MKNPFALSMTLLLALTLGGSIFGYRVATIEPAKPGAEAAATAGTAATGGTSTAQASTAQAPSTQAGSTVGGAAKNTTAGTQAGNTSGAPGSTSLAGTVSSNPADGSLAPSGPNAAQKGTQGTVAQGGSMAPAPASAAATATAGDAGKGKAVFAAASCAGCHGANGEGGGIGPSLHTADGPKSWTLDQFRTALRAGQSPQGPLKAPMPQFSPEQVSDADVANLHAYIKTLN